MQPAPPPAVPPPALPAAGGAAAAAPPAAGGAAAAVAAPPGGANYPNNWVKKGPNDWDINVNDILYNFKTGVEDEFFNMVLNNTLTVQFDNILDFCFKTFPVPPFNKLVNQHIILKFFLEGIQRQFPPGDFTTKTFQGWVASGVGRRPITPTTGGGKKRKYKKRKSKKRKSKKRKSKKRKSKKRKY